MNFLQPIMLYGVALVAVPLILHLLSRRRVREVVFPAMMFLLGTRRRSMRMLTLKQWLVLLCRMAAVGCIAAVAALPVLRHFDIGIAGTRTPVAVHILIDNTPSMGWRKAGVSFLDRARAAAEKIVGAAADDDYITVEPVCGTEISASGSAGRADLLRRLSSISIESCDADISHEMKLATARLNKENVGRRNLVVLSDFQKHSFRSEMPVPDAGDGIVVSAVDFAGGTQRKNVRIKKVDTPLYPLKGEDIPICYELTADGSYDSDIVVSLFIEGTKRGEHETSLDASGNAADCFTMTFGELGSVWGKVVISGDEMPEDNSRYFIIDVNKEINVLVLAPGEDVRDAGAGAFYVVRALRAASGAGPGESSILINTVSPGRLDKTSFDGVGAVMVPAVTELTENDVLLLGNYIASGGGVFVNTEGAGTGVELVAKAFFADGIDVSTARGAPGGDSNTESAASDFFTIGGMSPGHPLFTLRAGKLLIEKTDDIRFNAPAAIEVTSPETHVVATFSNGAPFIIERKIGKGRAVLAASSFRPTSTSFPLAPSFVPFTLQLARYLSNGFTDEADSFVAGSQISISIGGAGSDGRLTLKNIETGEETGMKMLSAGPPAEYVVDGEPAPGAYSISNGSGEKLDYITVNNDPGEGDLTPLAAAAWSNILDNKTTARLDASRFTDFERLQARLYKGRSAAAWFPFLFLGIIFLMAENALANRG